MKVLKKNIIILLIFLFVGNYLNAQTISYNLFENSSISLLGYHKKIGNSSNNIYSIELSNLQLYTPPMRLLSVGVRQSLTFVKLNENGITFGLIPSVNLFFIGTLNSSYYANLSLKLFAGKYGEKIFGGILLYPDLNVASLENKNTYSFMNFNGLSLNSNCFVGLNIKKSISISAGFINVYYVNYSIWNIRPYFGLNYYIR
jgi:hypothetical protein